MKQIISPHIDDAFLSLGGTIINWLKKGEKVKIFYVFSESNWTNPHSISTEKYGNDTKIVTQMRKNEEIEISQHLGHDFEFWGFPDNALRINSNTQNMNGLIRDVKSRITSKIEKQNVCFLPLGLGHPDHILLRQIALDLVLSNWNIIFFEELPYMAFNDDYQQMTELLSKNSFLPLTFEAEEIDIKSKLKVLEFYRSQISNDWLKNISTYAYSIKDNKYYERYWRSTGQMKENK